MGLLQQLRGLALYRHELVDGVEALLLDASAPVQLLGGDALLHQNVHTLGAAVPVGHRVPQDPALPVHQGEVHPPGVHPQGGGDLPQLCAGLQAVYHLPGQGVKVPAQAAAPLFGAVFEPVDLLQHDPSLLHMAQDVPPRGGADVHSQMIFHSGPSFHCSQHTAKPGKRKGRAFRKARPYFMPRFR